LDSLEIDQEVCDLLQEWFGYVVSGDSSKHKFLYLLGPTRAGKGVITRTLQSLVGASNYASPNLAQFGTNFGLQPTIGKSLITINDARFRGVRSAELVERLLNFTGGDSMTIDRKNREPWEGRPTARVMVVSNDPPSVTGEQTTAFARRILGPIELHRSFYDNEDYELEDRIAGELDAIMGWALDGYARLVARGRFVRPAASAELFREIEEAMSPVLAFVRDRCVHSPNHIVGKDQLYAAYKRWCADSGTYCASKVEFGRQLKGTLRDKVQWVKLPREAGKPRGNGWRGIRVIGAEYEL
jgi:putative DNA primase/helicase